MEIEDTKNGCECGCQEDHHGWLWWKPDCECPACVDVKQIVAGSEEERRRG